MPTFHSTDPRVTDIDAAILGAQRAVNAELAKFPHPDAHTPEGLEQLRHLTANNVAGTVLKPRDRQIDAGERQIRLRTFTPDGAVSGVFLRFHGGGWCAGEPEDDDTLNDQYARACNLIVVSPEYRLTPDVTLVEQLADCAAVAEWVGSNALKEFGTDRLLIGGISAGGHLAAATLINLKNSRSATFAKFVAAVLDSGAYDFARTPSAYMANDQSLIVTGQWLEAFIDLAMPGYTIDQRRDPRLSPAMNDLSGLPPALFTVGDLDPLRDESIIMAQRWMLAGSRADLDVWPEGAHAFANMATPLGALAAERTTSWINGRLADLGNIATPAWSQPAVATFS